MQGEENSNSKGQSNLEMIALLIVIVIAVIVVVGWLYLRFSWCPTLEEPLSYFAVLICGMS